jgi:hypothetical protein
MTSKATFTMLVTISGRNGGTKVTNTPMISAKEFARFGVTNMGREDKSFHLNALVEPNNHWLTTASLRMKTLLCA